MELKMDIRIVIAQRGFVYVGEYSRDGDRVFIRRGFNVRRWGTTKGLGELATRGPLAGTQLDDVPEVELHELSVVNTIRCDGAKWAGRLR